MPSDRLSGFSSAFDELLERSRRELDALSGGSGAPALSPTSRTSPRSPTTPAGAMARGVTQGASVRAQTPPPRKRSPAERALDEKLGPGWRYEVLDRTREDNELVVRCRVTAPTRGVSRTWHGTAPLSGTGRGGATGVSGSAGNVRFSLGARASARAAAGDPVRTEQEAERQAIESALAACARLI